jgi:hypothetical protein
MEGNGRERDKGLNRWRGYHVRVFGHHQKRTRIGIRVQNCTQKLRHAFWKIKHHLISSFLTRAHVVFLITDIYMLLEQVEEATSSDGLRFKRRLGQPRSSDSNQSVQYDSYQE